MINSLAGGTNQNAQRDAKDQFATEKSHGKVIVTSRLALLGAKKKLKVEWLAVGVWRVIKRGHF